MQVPFGKHRGWQVSDVPDDYLGWLRGVAHGPLREAIDGELRWRRARRWEQTSTPSVSALPVPPKARDLIEAGFRQLALRHHPDCGGGHDVMVEILRARDWLRDLVDVE